MSDTPAPPPRPRAAQLVHSCGPLCDPAFGLHTQVVVRERDAPQPERPWQVGMVFSTPLGLLRLIRVEADETDQVYDRRRYVFRALK